MNSRTGRWLLPCAVSFLAALSAPASAAPPPCSLANPSISPSNTTGAEGATVQLNGQTKDAATYLWEQTSGVPAVFDGTSDKNVKLTLPQVGPAGAALEVKLTVTGCDPIQTKWTTTTVNVTNVNTAPTAVATLTPSTVDEGGGFKLNASLSSDPEGDGLTYQWEQVDNLAFPVAALPSTAEIVDLEAPAGVPYPGGISITFRLTVSDGTLSNSTIAILTVKWVNAPPVATARVDLATCKTGEQTVAVPENASFTLDGAASSDDEDGIATYEWSQTLAGPFLLLPSGQTGSSVSLYAPSLTNGNGDAMEFQLKVTDNGNLSSVSEKCTVKVLDVTPPTLTLPSSMTLEATGPAGAVASFTASASDVVDGSVTATCLPASGSTFALGTTTVSCSSTDAHGNTATGSFAIQVVDTTPPTLALPPNIANVEATGPAGAPVSFSATASDLVDGPEVVTCNPASGSTFALGTTAVSCSSIDAHGNTAAGSFTIGVVDTTPPTVAHDTVTAEATGPDGAAVVFSVFGNDLVDGDSVPADCYPPSGTKFVLGATTVTCNATDKAGNKGTGSFTVDVVDTTPPVVSVPSDITTGPTQWNGAAVTFPPATAYDTVDTVVLASCSWTSGSVFPFGFTTVTCSATDTHGNTGTKGFTVIVTGFTFLGFFQPIDNLPVMNSVKGGATVPVKWRLKGQGGLEITDVAAVDAARLEASPINCSGTVALDIEFTMTGGTSLRYDPTAPQYILNWQTPKQPGTCWQLDVPFMDGTVRSAQFKLK